MTIKFKVLLAAVVTVTCVAAFALLHSDVVIAKSTLAGSGSPHCGGSSRSDGDGFAGVGWSTNRDTARAVQEAFRYAAGGGGSPPELSLVFFNPQHDPQTIVSALRGGTRPASKIFGQTTHEGVIDASGLHASADGVIGIECLRQPRTTVGIGGADFGEAAPREAAKLAYQRAVQDAGSQPRKRTPAMILLCVTLPNEEEVLAGLGEEAGPGIPLIGGTAAGSVDALSRKKISNWSIIAGERIIQNGVGVALFYCDEPFGWSYGGGYRRTSVSGVVTKCQPRLILEIDGKPAADVYDQWLGGRVREAIAQGKDAAQFCGFYPISRYKGGHNQFIRAWPSEDPKFPGSLRTGSSVSEGDEVFLSEGNWNLLLNHFASVPRRAMEQMDGSQALSGLFIYCGGALACLPPTAREQMSALVSQTMKDRPWLGVFTWGEQGNIPSVGNLHSNLSSGMVLFPASGPDQPIE